MLFLLIEALIVQMKTFESETMILDFTSFDLQGFIAVYIASRYLNL